MANLTSVLTVRLIDAVSGPARAAAVSLLGIGKAATAASGRGVVGIGTNLTRMGENAKAAAKHLTAAGNTLRGMTLPTALLGGFAAKSVFEFEKVGNTIEAVTNITKAQRNELQSYAQSLNALFPFKNTQIMQSALELGRAGLTFDQIMGALKGTLNLALAGNIELAESSDIATNVLTAMRLPMKTTQQVAESLARVNDVLSFGANQSNADVRQLGETFKYVAPLAAAAGLSIEDVAAMAAVMANNGIRASEAGVAMRSALVRMVRPTREMSATLGRLGINLSDFVSAKPITADHVISSLRAGGINAQGSRAAIDAALGDPTLRRDQNALLARLTEIVGPGAGAMDAQVVADQIRDAINIAGSKIDLPGFIAALQRVGATVGDMARVFDQRQGGRLETLRVGAHNFADFLRRLQSDAVGSTDRAARIMQQGVVGAWARFAASIDNLVMAIARSGVLETATSALTKFAAGIEHLARVNPQLLEFGTYAVLIGAAAGPLVSAMGSIAGIVSLLLLLGGKGALRGAAAAGIGSGTAALAGAGVGAAAARRGIFGGLLGPLGWAFVAKEAADIVDAKGNLFGLTAGIDRWVERHLGFNPSSIGGDGTLPGAPDAINANSAAFNDRLRAIRAWMHPEHGITDRQGNPINKMGSGPSVPSVAPKVTDQAGEMSGAGHTLGGALMTGLETELRARLPGIIDDVSRQLSSITVRPTISPRVDSSALRGTHADVGVDVTR